jgi:hypothetical protein
MLDIKKINVLGVPTIIISNEKQQLIMSYQGKEHLSWQYYDNMNSQYNPIVTDKLLQISYQDPVIYNLFVNLYQELITKQTTHKKAIEVLSADEPQTMVNKIIITHSQVHFNIYLHQAPNYHLNYSVRFANDKQDTIAFKKLFNDLAVYEQGKTRIRKL